MEIRELRIGNIIYDRYGNISPVTSINGSGFIEVSDSEGDLYGFNSHECNPIPITPEWLERFGFVKIYQDSYKHLTGWLIIDCMGDYYQFPMGCLQIRYVHQLMNLYFALTGSELTIKEATQPEPEQS